MLNARETLDIKSIDIETPVPRAPRRLSAVNNPSPADFPRETPEQYRAAMEGRLRTLQAELDNPDEFGTGEPDVRAAVQREVAATEKRIGAAPSAPRPAPAEKRPPKWSDVEASPKYQALDGEGRKSVRESFWRDVVSPLVPTDELEEARKAFDERTNQSIKKRAGKAPARPESASLPSTMDAETGGAPAPAETSSRLGVDLSGETLDQLERGYRGLKQGAYATGLGVNRRQLDALDRIDRGEKVSEVDDPGGYQHMDGEQRAQYKAQLASGYTKQLKEIASEAVKISDLYHNPNAQESIKAANEGRWKDAWEAFAADPVGIVKDLSLSNAAQVAPMAVLGTAGAAIKGIPGLMLGFAGGSFPVDYAMSLVEYLNDQKVDLRDAAAVDAKLREPDFLDQWQTYAGRHAAGVAAGDAIATGFMKPVRGTLATAAKAAARNIGIGVGGESGGEALGQVLATGEIKPGDVIAEGLAAGPMVAAGSVASTAAAPKPAPAALPGHERADIPTDPAELSRMIAGDEPAAPPLAPPVAPAAPAEQEPIAAAAPASKAPPVATQQAESQLEAQPVAEEAAAPSGVAAPAGEAVPAGDIEGAAEGVAEGLKQTFQSPVDEEAHAAATSPHNELPAPSEAQIEANNAPLGHPRIAGLDISIENPEGSERSGTDANGKPWSVTMKSHYGYIRRSESKDGDQVDVFVKPGTPEDLPDAAKVYVIDQRKPGNGHFDEVKAMLGWNTEEAARRAYRENYTKDWDGIQAVTKMTLPEFKQWLREGDTTKPAREHQPVLDARRATSNLATDFAEHVRAGNGFETVAEARAFALGRVGPGVATGPALAESMDGALEQGATLAAKSLESRMRRRGATGNEIAAARREFYSRLPERLAMTARSSVESAEVHPAAGIALNAPYTGAGSETVNDAASARPDAIRQAVRDLFRVPINEGGFKGSRDMIGIYKVQPRTIRVRNQNDIGVIAHETGHHFSETSRPVRKLMKAHEQELRAITPYAASQKSAALQREEGFAEYLRLRWTQPEHAKAAAPGFSKAFEQYVDQGGYRPAFEAIESAIRDWQNLPPAERILAKVGEPEPEFRKRFNLDRLLFEVFDNWLPMKRMVEDLKPDVAAGADPFKLAHLLAGDSALIEDWLLRETTPFDFTRRANPQDRGKPLVEVLKPIMDQQREFGAYLIAKRANELMRRGKEHLYSPDEIAAGLRLETPEFKAAAKELYAYQDRLLDYPVEGGLLSTFAADKFRQFPFYVPFFRVGEPIARRGEIFKEIRGGTENLRDPIANIIENTVRVIHATNRNYVLAKAHDLARSVPGGGRWIESVPMPERAVRIQTEKVIEQLREQGVEVDSETAAALATTQTFFVKNPFGDDSNRIIVTRRQGRAAAVQVNDELLWRALERFEPLDLGLIEKLLSVPADLLRAGVVLSPEFMARNFARDTVSGFIQSKAGILPVAGTLEGFKEIATRSDASRLYRAFGGAYGDMWRSDSGTERKLVERMARHGGFDPRTIVTPRGLLSLLYKLGSITEAGTRVAEFKKSMKPGDIDSLIDAAYNAREVSVDFGMHGHSQAVRFLTRITPFLNPALQGWYKAARTGGSAPFVTLLRGGMLTVASVLLYLWNHDKDWYDEIEQWEKSVYWHIDIGLRDDRGKAIPLRIPRPWEWGAAFGSIPEALTQVAIEKNGKHFAKRLESIVDNVFSFRVIPTALLVPAELWANKNTFTDRPIVPKSKERLEPALQTTPATTTTARKLGELSATSPTKIDYAVRGFFGTLGTYSLMLTDQALHLGGADKAPALPLPWQRAPVVRAFFHDPSGANSRHVTEFYELLKDAQQAEATLRHLHRDEMRPYFEKRKEALRAFPVATAAARVMAVLRRENDRITGSADFTPDEKADRIAANNERIRSTAKAIVRAIEKQGAEARQ